jgi:hypothetical protein
MTCQVLHAHTRGVSLAVWYNLPIHH